jgi:pimeloyl-ACP methyl ester carboxylesterase
MAEFTVLADGVVLAGDDSGEGVDTVLLHGLTATRDYVVHGSKALQRAGHRVVAYDARGHGQSGGADDYSYAALARDLEAVMDDRGIDQALLAGASMGAHTLVRFTLDHPDRVRAAVIITPAFDPDSTAVDDRWRRLSDGLRTDGVEGFVAATDLASLPEQWRPTVERVIRSRMAAHGDLGALADALDAVPRSRPFESWAELGDFDAPSIVVVSRDEADPEHPQRIGDRYAATIRGSQSVSEPLGESPLAWQGGRLARLIADAA